MEKKVVANKRLSILKKRRSRSLSPSKSPQLERRTSRRISFSGKHAVREFFVGVENKETIWGASYEESTEQLTVNSDQLSRQQQSLRLSRTKNDTIHSVEAMECSSIIASTSSTQLTSASLAISATFRHDRTMHANVPIAVAEKENVFFPSEAKVRVNEKPTNASDDAMNISLAEPTKTISKIKLFASIHQKKATASDTHHQTNDISLEMSSIASNRITTQQNVSRLDDNSRSPTPPSRSSQLHRTNETTLNTNMSVLSAQRRPSVICKSPSKNASNRAHKNQTINFGSDTMDVTQGVKGDINLQESRYPLNATSMEQSHIDIPAKPAVVTNPYLKMFLGETSTNSVSERERLDTEVTVPTAPPSTKKNVTLHETSSIALDYSNGAQLFEYPDPAINSTLSEATAPIYNARNVTLYNQCSVGKSFDFPLSIPVAQMQDKENIFVVPPTPTPDDCNATAPINNARNETIYNHFSIENSFDFPLPKPVAQTQNQENICIMPPIPTPDDCKATAPINNARNETVYNHFSIENSFDFPLPKPVAQTQNQENICVMPPIPTADDFKASGAAARVSLSESINTTVFNFHHDHMVNSTYRSNGSNLETTPRQPIELTNVSLDVSVANIPKQLTNAMPHPQPPSQETIYCNQSIQNENAQISDHGNESIEITNPISTPAMLAVSKPRRVTCFRSESIDESVAIDNEIHANEHHKISMSPAVVSSNDFTVHDGQMNIEATTSVPSIGHCRNAARRATTVFENEPISAESTLKPLPASALNSYHHLTMEQTQIASRDTSVIQPSSTLVSVSQSPLLATRLSIESSRPLDEFCQLTFIEDTDIDLVGSIDSVDGDDDEHVIVEENSSKIPFLLSRSCSNTSAFGTRVGNSQVSLASPFPQSIDERHTFKKSSLLQSSTANMDNENPVPTTSAAAEPVSRCMIREPEPVAAQTKQNDADTTGISYLHNVTKDKHVKDIKLDFSGYEKFKGLATPNDVCNAFFQRCEIFKQRMHQVKEADKAKHIPDPQSQNLEAPSLKFLFFNKLAQLDAENAAKFKAECNEKPIGALTPVTPALLELIKNKCKELKHWRFESLWFYRGRLILRHKILQSYKFILDFDPEHKAVDDHISMYGKLMFIRARTVQCPIWLARLRPIDRLRLQTTIASEPINLLQMCPSSNDLSTFDENMDTIVRNACNKVTNLALVAIDANAVLMIDNDLVYIHCRFDDREHLRLITYNIKLSDIDRTGPECVQTIPFRVLHNDVNALPRGVDFIREFLRNDRKYLTEQTEAD